MVVVVSKSLFILLLVALPAAVVSFQSDDSRQGEFDSFQGFPQWMRAEIATDRSALDRDISALRYEVVWAPRAIESFWTEFRSECRSLGRYAAAEVKQAAQRMPI